MNAQSKITAAQSADPAKEARIDGLWRERRDALMAVSTERAQKLAADLAKIDAAMPTHTNPGEIFARLIAAGQPVAVIVERGV